jgi:putative inorganic carbon (hco3(-)) transporter
VITGQFDVACWVQDVQTRVFASFGQPNWLAAFLITTLPISLFGFTTQARQKWLWIVTVLATLALLFTKSRSGVLGLGVGLSTLLLSQLIFIRTNFKQLFISLGVIGLIAVVFGTPFTPALSRLWQPPSLIETAQPSGTVLDTGGTESGEIRKIVWEGAFKVWQRYPVFGSGVETFAYSYYQDRPVEHNNVSEWDFLYNKAHNEFLNYLATTGAVGAFSYVLLLVWFGLVCLALANTQRLELHYRQLAIALLSGVVALSVSNFFGFSTVVVNVLLFWYMAVVSILNKPPITEEVTMSNKAATRSPANIGQWLALSFTMIVTAILLYQVYQQWWADRLFVRAKSLFGAGQYELALDHLRRLLLPRPLRLYSMTS